LRESVCRAILVGALIGATFAACGTQTTTLSSPPTTDPALTLTTQHSPVGLVLATGAGNTLYDFVPDSPTHSACLNDGCVYQWPPLLVSGPVSVGPGVNRSLVGTLRRPDGTMQVSYRGHPLYTYRLDVTPGMVTGQAIDQDGGPWYVLSPAGSEIKTTFTVSG
jgi:predicted lipoprotein with Yx(FWY)xxD motif